MARSKKGCHLEIEGFRFSNNTSASAQLLQNLWQRSLFTNWQQVNSDLRREIRQNFLQLGYLLSEGDPTDELAQKKMKILSDLMASPSFSIETFQQISQGCFTDAEKLQMFAAVIETVSQIRRAQSLDLSTRIDRLEPERIREQCLKCLELKGGALIALSLRLGALIAAHPACVQKVTSFGIRLGMALQKLDELESLQFQNPKSKCMEDLKLRRPVWAWAALAENCDDSEWREFQVAVNNLPDTECLANFIEKNHFRERGLIQVIRELRSLLVDLKNEFGLSEESPAYIKAKELKTELIQAHR